MLLYSCFQFYCTPVTDFTAFSDSGDNELKRTTINITCYDRNGDLVKRVTSADDGDVEDNENSGENQGEEQGGEQTPKKMVNLTVSPAGAGTVTGGGQCDSGASVNI